MKPKRAVQRLAPDMDSFTMRRLPSALASQTRGTLIGIALVLLAAACWGTSGIFVKRIMAANPVSALSLAFWRDTSAFVVFLLLSWRMQKGAVNIRSSDWVGVAGMGLSLGVFHVVLNLSYRLNGAALTTIYQTAMPAIVLLASRLIWKEALTPRKIGSLVIIAIGTICVSGVIHRSSGGDLTVAGLLVGMLVPALYASWSLWGKMLRRGYTAIITLTWAFGIAALILLIVQLGFGGLIPPPASALFIVDFVGLVVISTVFPFFAFTASLGRLSAGIASMVVMSEIVFAILLARFFLGETLDGLEILGALVIVTGVLLLLRQGRDRSTAGVR